MARAHGAVAVGIASVAMFALVACGEGGSESVRASGSSPSPEYWVDGARPSPGADGSDDAKGCVPYSEDRTDVMICGAISDTFRPAPPPGDYADYPEVCEAAAQVFHERAAELEALYDLSALPRIDLQSCGAAGLGDVQEERWMVKFALLDLEEVAPFRSAVLPDLTPGTPEKAGVRLSEAGWPLA